MNSFTITEGRHRVVDFTVPVFFDDFLLMMRKPRATGIDYFITPLSWQVWLAVGVSIPGKQNEQYLLCLFIHICMILY